MYFLYLKSHHWTPTKSRDRTNQQEGKANTTVLKSNTTSMTSSLLSSDFHSSRTCNIHLVPVSCFPVSLALQSYLNPRCRSLTHLHQKLLDLSVTQSKHQELNCIRSSFFKKANAHEFLIHLSNLYGCTSHKK